MEGTDGDMQDEHVAFFNEIECAMPDVAEDVTEPIAEVVTVDARVVTTSYVPLAVNPAGEATGQYASQETAKKVNA